MSDNILAVAALEEAVELLEQDNARLRQSNRILRIVNSGLRSKMEIAHRNDEEFKSACQEDILPESPEPALEIANKVMHEILSKPMPGWTYPFQPLVIDAEPESDATGYVDKAAPDSIEYKEIGGLPCLPQEHCQMQFEVLRKSRFETT